MVKTPREIEAEIEALAPLTKYYDIWNAVTSTWPADERQPNDIYLAAGARWAMRWVLGLAEIPLSEKLKAAMELPRL